MIKLLSRESITTDNIKLKEIKKWSPQFLRVLFF